MNDNEKPINYIIAEDYEDRVSCKIKGDLPNFLALIREAILSISEECDMAPTELATVLLMGIQIAERGEDNDEKVN
jgi:hypothetical protein